MLKPLAILLALAVFATGCSIPKVPRVKSPSATVVGMTVTEQTNEGATVAVVVEMSNPNDFALPVTFETYRLNVGGKSFAFSGRAEASMPPNNTQAVTLRGAVATEGQDLSGAAYSASGHFVYVKPGEIRKVLVDSGLPEAKVFFSGEGKLD